MEMTYDGALVMPSSFAMMDEEEMMYVEGGKEAIVKEIIKFLKDYVISHILDYLVETIWNNRKQIWEHFLNGLKPNERTKATPYYKTFSHELAKLL